MSEYDDILNGVMDAGHAANLVEKLQEENAKLKSYFEQEQMLRMDWNVVIEDLQKKLEKIKTLVKLQAMDDGLWFEAKTAPEEYLQQELRRLHAVIEE